SSSDSRLKFNSKSLTNGLTVINKLEPLEYDQIYELVEQYSPDAPQSHQCGFIAHSVEEIDELRHAVVGGQVGEDGKESLRGLNYNAILTYAVKSQTIFEPNSEGSTGAN
ncbi:MAG: tail fiber domain-containing protein, partial [Candidatus Fonsibacter sp.]